MAKRWTLYEHDDETGENSVMTWGAEGLNGLVAHFGYEACVTALEGIGTVEGNKTAFALARTVLFHPTDRTAICALMDTLQAWLDHAPSAEADAKRLAEEVEKAREGAEWGHDAVNYAHVYTEPLLDKLREMGYGEAVDAYTRPRAGINMGPAMGVLRWGESPGAPWFDLPVADTPP